MTSKVLQIEKSIKTEIKKKIINQTQTPPPKKPPNKFYNVKARIGPSLKKEEPCNNTSYNPVTKQTHLDILIKKKDGQDKGTNSQILHVSWTIKVQGFKTS